MKNLFTLFVATVMAICIQAQTEITVPYNTRVPCELTGTVTLDDKPGTEVGMIVKEDVLVNDKVVIAKNTPVNATIRVNKKPKTNYYTTNEFMGELLIDINYVTAVDGSRINLNTCYVQYFAEKNTNWFDKQRRWLLRTGTLKNCNTSINVKVKVN